ncbi:MAG: RelA/SpoT domain-containing protein [Pseudomonadota bacterium]
MTSPEAKDKLTKKVDGQVKGFKKNRKLFNELCKVIMATLSNATRTIPGNPIVHGQVKEIDSFVEKFVRKDAKYHTPAWQLTDLCGVRAILLSKDTIPAVQQFIESSFLVTEKEDTAGRLDKTAFGYQSMHSIVALDPAKGDVYQNACGKIVSRKLFASRSSAEATAANLNPGPIFKAEIQVRTLLQHAWSGAVHDNIYKTDIRSIPETNQGRHASSLCLV